MPPTSKPLKRPYPFKDADFDNNSSNGPTIRRKTAEKPIVPPLVPITRTDDESLMNETLNRILKGIEKYKTQILIPYNFEDILFAFGQMSLHSQETIPQPSNSVPIPQKTCQCHTNAHNKENTSHLVPIPLKNFQWNHVDQNPIPTPNNTKNVIIPSKYTLEKENLFDFSDIEPVKQEVPCKKVVPKFKKHDLDPIREEHWEWSIYF